LCARVETTRGAEHAKSPRSLEVRFHGTTAPPPAPVSLGFPPVRAFAARWACRRAGSGDAKACGARPQGAGGRRGVDCAGARGGARGRSRADRCDGSADGSADGLAGAGGGGLRDASGLRRVNRRCGARVVMAGRRTAGGGATLRRARDSVLGGAPGRRSRGAIGGRLCAGRRRRALRGRRGRPAGPLHPSRQRLPQQLRAGRDDAARGRGGQSRPADRPSASRALR
jgi:hypothetical protein